MIKSLNKIHLQLIAIIAMTVDHVTWMVFPGYSTEPLAIFFHIIGRLAMPIFAYFIAEGYHYTHDKKKYILRIFLFSLISHVPYMMSSVVFQNYGWLSIIPFATGNGITRFLNQGSVLFAYFIGLIMLCVHDSKKIRHWQKAIAIFLLSILSFPCDWSCIASLVVLTIGDNRGKPLKQVSISMFWILMYATVYFFAIDKLYGMLQLLVILSVPILMLYNGKKSNNEHVNRIMKWFFYIYYPLHLLIIGMLGLII